MSTVIGIDLGATSTRVAVVDSGAPSLIRGKQGQRALPTAVAVAADGTRLVGQTAKRQAATNATNTVLGAKRLLGRRASSAEVGEIAGFLSYPLVEGPQGDVRVALRDRDYSIPELLSFVLQESKRLAEAHIGQPVERAVVAVPSWFDDGQRHAMRDAGRIAGLDVLRIVNAPTAAALAHGFRKNLDGKIAIVDVGGASVDCAIVATCDEVFEVVASAGDRHGGGDSWDRRIAEHLLAGFLDENGIDLREVEGAWLRLLDGAEKARCELSTARSAQINLPFIAGSDRPDAAHLLRELSRDEMDAMCADLVARMVAVCDGTLGMSRVERRSLSDVLLVGGMARSPAVVAAVRQLFGREPTVPSPPDESVALGAAIQAAALTCEPGVSPLLVDATPHAFGFHVAGGPYLSLIDRNATIPCGRAHGFRAVRDDRASVAIRVVQGEGEPDRAPGDELLGEASLTGLRIAPVGDLEVEVHLDVTADGTVAISARDRATGRRHSVKLAATARLTDEEIATIMAYSREYDATASVDDDPRRMELTRLIREIETLWPRVEPLIAVGEMGLDALAQASEGLVKARAVVAGEARVTLSDVRRTLERTLHLFHIALREPRV